MRTIAVVGLKGGGGKSTITSHIAIGMTLRGRRTAVLDLDRQKSVYGTLSLRNKSDEYYISCGALDLSKKIEIGQGVQEYKHRMQENGADFFIIDTPAGEGDVLESAVSNADICIFIIRPTYLDLIAVASTLEKIRPLRKMCLAVLNQAPPSRGDQEPAAVRKAKEVLTLLKVAVAPTVVRTRLVYQQCLEQGFSVEEDEQGDVAKEEMKTLVDFLHRFIFGNKPV